MNTKKEPHIEAQFVNGADDMGVIELFGEAEMPIILPDKGKYTYKNLVCIMKQCTQTYYNIRQILGLKCL